MTRRPAPPTTARFRSILPGERLGQEPLRIRRAAEPHKGCPLTPAERSRRPLREAECLIANPAAAGTGFTLTAASFTIYESLSWRYDHYAQSQDRNHRIGQTQPVTYLRLIAVDTIEEAIVTALERKALLAGSLLGDDAMGDLVSQLSKEEMCQLLMSNSFPNKASKLEDSHG